MKYKPLNGMFWAELVPILYAPVAGIIAMVWSLVTLFDGGLWQNIQQYGSYGGGYYLSTQLPMLFISSVGAIAGAVIIACCLFNMRAVNRHFKAGAAFGLVQAILSFISPFAMWAVTSFIRYDLQWLMLAAISIPLAVISIFRYYHMLYGIRQLSMQYLFTYLPRQIKKVFVFNAVVSGISPLVILLTSVTGSIDFSLYSSATDAAGFVFAMIGILLLLIGAASVGIIAIIMLLRVLRFSYKQIGSTQPIDWKANVPPQQPPRY